MLLRDSPNTSLSRRDFFVHHSNHLIAAVREAANDPADDYQFVVLEWLGKLLVVEDLLDWMEITCCWSKVELSPTIRPVLLLNTLRLCLWLAIRAESGSQGSLLCGIWWCRAHPRHSPLLMHAFATAMSDIDEFSSSLVGIGYPRPVLSVILDRTCWKGYTSGSLGDDSH